MDQPELAVQARRRLEATGRVLAAPPGHPDVEAALRALVRDPEGERAITRLLEAEAGAAQAETQRVVLEILYGRSPGTGPRSAFVTRRLHRLGPLRPVAQRLLDAPLPGKRLLRRFLTVGDTTPAAAEEDTHRRATRLWS